MSCSLRHFLLPTSLVLLAVGCADPRLEDLEERVAQIEADHARVLAENDRLRADLDELLRDREERAARSERLSSIRGEFRDRLGSSASGEADVEPPPWRDDIEKVSDTEVIIERGLFGALVEDPESLSRQARVARHRRADGEIDGYRLSGIRRGTVLEALGIRNGDVIHSVNGHSLTSAEETLQAYTELGGADEIALEVTRRGVPTVLTYRIGEEVGEEEIDGAVR